ncbi:cytidine deaminase-like protein [Abortiporus biennis]|nr:cytidine deaminase-like protein [Abortiporus biennis]
MFIALVGTRFAGKSTVEDFLIKEKNFTPVRLVTSTSHSALLFQTPDGLLDHITKNWRSDFVTVDLNTKDLLDTFVTRPFVLVVNVDAPLLIRFHRGSKGIDRMVNLRVVNSFNTVSALHAHLNGLDLTNNERLRPTWDTYFMKLASLASHRSNCMKRRVGAILVRNNRILSTGYNGTPRGLTNCNEGGCIRCNSASETSDECVCLHAEENALLEAGRDRVGDGSVIYCNTCPCLKCTIKIIQTGVKEVVYNLSYRVDDASAALFKQAGITLRRHAPPPED